MFVGALHETFNFILKPLVRECFFEDLESPSLTRVIETFMEAGGLVDITLNVYGPLTIDEIRREAFEAPVLSRVISIEDEEGSDSLAHSETFTAETEGTYAFCLDNREARFVPKAVEIDVRLPPRAEPIVMKTKPKTEGGEGSGEGGLDDPEAEQRVKETLTRIQRGLTKIQLQQQRDRRRLSFQDKTNSDSHNDFIMGSIVETAFFIGAAMFQIFFIRRWFHNRNVPGAKLGV